MQDDEVASLVQDVLDVMTVGSYGLYELIWTLNAKNVDSEMVAVATQAVTRLVKDHAVQLVRLRWPSEDVLAEVALDDLSDRDFDCPGSDGLYVAMTV